MAHYMHVICTVNTAQDSSDAQVASPNILICAVTISCSSEATRIQVL